MRTALAIVNIDENDECPEQVPIKIIEVATPEEIDANLDRLLSGYPVRDAAYNAMLKLRFLIEKLYIDTANPNNPAAGYKNIILFLAISNWEKLTSTIADSIKRKQQEKLDAAPNMMAKAGVMFENTKESAGIKIVFSALDVLKEYLEGKMSQSFSPDELDKVLNTLQTNLPVYTGELSGIVANLQAVCTNPDAAFEDVDKINTFFQHANEGIEFLAKSEFTPKN